MDNLTPTGNRVLLVTEESPCNINGIFIPESSRIENHIGTVIAIGPEVRDIEVGDRVMYYPLNGYKFDGHRIILLQDIIGVVYDE